MVLMQYNNTTVQGKSVGPRDIYCSSKNTPRTHTQKKNTHERVCAFAWWPKSFIFPRITCNLKFH